MTLGVEHALSDALIVFDLDGTVVDTAPDLLGALNAVLRAEGIAEASGKATRHLMGHGAAALLKRGYALAERPWDDARQGELVARLIEIYRTRIAEESRRFPGLDAALDVLERQGARFAICTNKPTHLALALIEALRLTHRFHAIVGGDIVPAAKPDAGHILATIEAAKGLRGRAVMVGDSSNDIVAARAAGIPSIAVSFGYFDGAVSALEADAVIDSFAELPEAVAALLSPVAPIA